MDRGRLAAVQEDFQRLGSVRVRPGGGGGAAGTQLARVRGPLTPERPARPQVWEHLEARCQGPEELRVAFRGTRAAAGGPTRFLVGAYPHYATAHVWADGDGAEGPLALRSVERGGGSLWEIVAELWAGVGGGAEGGDANPFRIDWAALEAMRSDVEQALQTATLACILAAVLRADKAGAHFPGIAEDVAEDLQRVVRVHFRRVPPQFLAPA